MHIMRIVRKKRNTPTGVGKTEFKGRTGVNL